MVVCVCKWMKGRRVACHVDPLYTESTYDCDGEGLYSDRDEPFGKVIDAYLKKEIELASPQALHLAFSLNRWQKVSVILWYRVGLSSNIDLIFEDKCF